MNKKVNEINEKLIKSIKLMITWEKVNEIN